MSGGKVVAYRPTLRKDGNARFGYAACMTSKPDPRDSDWRGEDGRQWVKAADYAALQSDLAAAIARAEAAEADSKRLDYIEQKFSGMTNRERYLPVQMIWGKGCNGRTLREACDKYMGRDAIAAQQAEGEDRG